MCPGFLTVPLLNTSLLALTACPPLQGMSEATLALYDSTLKDNIAPFLVAPTLGPVLAILCFIACAVLLIARVLGCHKRVLRDYLQLLAFCDMFTQRLPPPPPAKGSMRYVKWTPPPPRNPCGGAWTLFTLTLLMLILFYYVASFFSLYNVAATTTLGFLKDSTRLQFQQAPWLRTPDAGNSGPALPSFQGILVRVLAQGEPGMCSQPLPLPDGTQFTAMGLDDMAAKGPGSWVLLPPHQPLSSAPQGGLAGALFPGAPNASAAAAALATAFPLTSLNVSDAAAAAAAAAGSCGGSGFSLFYLACPACELMDAATLSFNMHYSCQALVIEALSAGPGDASALSGPEVLSLTQPLASLYRVSADLADTRGNGSAFLSAVKFHLAVMRGVVRDDWRTDMNGHFFTRLPIFFGIQGYKPIGGRGYIIYGGSSEGVFVNANEYLAANSSVLFTPLLRSVQVTLSLSSSAVYSVTSLSLTTTLTMLLTSILSLAGVFSISSLIYAHIIVGPWCLGGCTRPCTKSPDLDEEGEEEEEEGASESSVSSCTGCPCPSKRGVTPGQAQREGVADSAQCPGLEDSALDKGGGEEEAIAATFAAAAAAGTVVAPSLRRRPAQPLVFRSMRFKLQLQEPVVEDAWGEGGGAGGGGALQAAAPAAAAAAPSATALPNPLLLARAQEAAAPPHVPGALVLREDGQGFVTSFAPVGAGQVKRDYEGAQRSLFLGDCTHRGAEEDAREKGLPFSSTPGRAAWKR